MSLGEDGPNNNEEDRKMTPEEMQEYRRGRRDQVLLDDYLFRNITSYRGSAQKTAKCHTYIYNPQLAWTTEER